MQDLDYGRDQMRLAELTITGALAATNAAKRLELITGNYERADAGLREAMALTALTRLALAQPAR